MTISATFPLVPTLAEFDALAARVLALETALPPGTVIVPPAPPADPAIPVRAAAAGYLTQTFGPEIVLDSNWFVVSGQATKNPDGSVTIPGSPGYSDNLQTAKLENGTFTGVTFGGGGYFECVMKFTGPPPYGVPVPAVWANDIQNQLQNAYGTGQSQWPGQAKGYVDSIEWDLCEVNNGAGSWGFTVHSWYGPQSAIQDQAAVSDGSPVNGLGDQTQYHTYAGIWVLATDTAQGYIQHYFDDRPIGNRIVWNKYNPALPPPPREGANAFSRIDVSHLYWILGTGPSNPMTVKSFRVFQKSGAQNLPPTITTPPTTTTPPISAMTPRGRVLARLAAIKGTGFVLSQQCHTDLREQASDIAAGLKPGMIWTDPWQDGQPASAGQEPNTAALIAFAKAGGLVGVSTAIPNPVTGGGVDADHAAINPAQMITPGTTQYNAFVALADRMAGWLKPLEDAGIAYLHRFLLEADMGAFWYRLATPSDPGGFTPAQHAQLYAIWTNRLRGHGLNNMITVWSTNGNRIDHFPGKAVTDINGWDYYGDNPGNMTGHYKALRALGLPVAMTEFGSGGPNGVNRAFDCQVLVDAWKAMPEVLWCNFWTGWEPALLANNGVLGRAPMLAP